MSFESVSLRKYARLEGLGSAIAPPSSSGPSPAAKRTFAQFAAQNL